MENKHLDILLHKYANSKGKDDTAIRYMIDHTDISENLNTKFKDHYKYVQTFGTQNHISQSMFQIIKRTGIIESFKTKGNNWLSNFYPVEIEFQGKKYASVEHAYMSAKSNNPAWKHKCQDRNISPGKIKRLSRDITLIDGWHDKKLDVMKVLINRKFNNPQLKEKLLSTGHAHIQEGNTWNDKYWGICLKTGEGENNLGKLIMNKKNELRYDSTIN